MRSFKLTLAYDGTAYAGWQVQKGHIAVQEVLESAIEKVTGERARAIASGRTDAGVHALGQVVGFRTETHLSADVLQRALNAELPQDVAVLEAAEARENFHPIRDAVRKRYRYAIHDGPVRDVFRRRYCWHYAGRLDEAAMARAAQALLGKHDFRSFETSGAQRKDSIRTIYELTVERGRGGERDAGGKRGRGGQRGPGIEQGRGVEHDLITIEVEADGFLYNMVRAIVGTLVEVGRGAAREGWIADVLAARDRRAAGPTAPPQGLFLVRVDYPRTDDQGASPKRVDGLSRDGLSQHGSTSDGE
jgi:tRNA pseudouridine38-40 synthase